MMKTQDYSVISKLKQKGAPNSTNFFLIFHHFLCCFSLLRESIKEFFAAKKKQKELEKQKAVT